jgi:hypothetical protein
MCVTYARGIDEDAFIRACGGEPAATATRTMRQLGEELSPYRYDQVPNSLLVTAVGDWLVGVEVNGFQGSRPEVMRGASAGDAAVSVYWNVNGTNRFTYNVAGRRRVCFDMGDVDRRWGSEPDALNDELTDLPFDGRSVRWSVGLALAERLTGVRLTEELFEGGFRRAFLTEVEEDLVPEGTEDRPALDDPFVRAVLAEPTVDKLPAITRFLAHLVARDAGIQHEPAVREALRIVDERADGRAVPADTHLPERLRGLADGLQAAARSGADPDAFRRMHAVLWMLGALDADPGEAAFPVYWYGGYSVKDRDAQLVNTVLHRCRARALKDAAGRRSA